MKKTLSIIISAIILVSSVFSVTAFAADKTRTETLFEKYNETKEIAVTLQAGDIPLFGANSDASDTIYIKDDMAAYEYNAGFINIRVVFDGEEIVAFIPSFPYIHVKLESKALGSLDISGLLEEASKVTLGVLNHVDTYEEELGGIKYTVEEYNDRAQVTSKFYYQNDELKILRVEDKKTFSVQNTYFDSISFEVEDDIFELPFISFDLTPLLQGLFIALLGSVALPV